MNDKNQEQLPLCPWCRVVPIVRYNSHDSGTRVRCENKECSLATLYGYMSREAWSRRADEAAAGDTGQAQRWSSDPPTTQGWYWHWDGDKNSAPFPLSVLRHGAGERKCFVSLGQAGLDRAIECDEYGGFWMPLLPPLAASAVPDEKCPNHCGHDPMTYDFQGACSRFVPGDSATGWVKCGHRCDFSRPAPPSDPCVEAGFHVCGPRPVSEAAKRAAEKLKPYFTNHVNAAEQAGIEATTTINIAAIIESELTKE